MPKIYTENDLLLYLYNELPDSEVADLNAELVKNPVLSQQYQTLKTAIGALDALSVEPSASSVELVMEYAKKLAAPEMEKV